MAPFTSSMVAGWGLPLLPIESFRLSSPIVFVPDSPRLKNRTTLKFNYGVKQRNATHIPRDVSNIGSLALQWLSPSSDGYR